jgi:hypothetical protein
VGCLDEKVTEALMWELFFQSGPVGEYTMFLWYNQNMICCDTLQRLLLVSDCLHVSGKVNVMLMWTSPVMGVRVTGSQWIEWEGTMLLGRKVGGKEVKPNFANFVFILSN